MKKTTLLLSVLCLATGVFARSYEWSWRMPTDKYQNLEFTLRSGVDRATKVFAQADDAERRGTKVTDLVPMYRAARAEWKKVQIQAEAEGFDEQLLSYVIFMQGLCAARAHDRNEAIKMFGEVIDLYPDETWVSYPARYYLGVTKVGMGDVRAGDADLDELIELSRQSDNAIIAYAINSRAGRLWDAGKGAQAIELWKDCQRRFREICWYPWSSANDSIGFAAAVTGDIESMQEAVYARNEERDAKKKVDRQVEVIERHLDWYLNGMRYSWVQPLKYFYDKYEKESARREKIQQFSKNMATWAAAQRPAFEAAGRAYEATVYAFRIKVMSAKPADLAKEADAIRAGIQKEQNPKLRARWAWATAMTLAYCRAYDMARPFADIIGEPLVAAKLRYEIEKEAGEWKAAVLALDEIISREVEPADQQKWRYELGWVYRDRIKDFEKAIKTYAEISDPPRQLWEISWAYRYAKKNKEAFNALTEIASMFPKDAPDAVFRMAEWREQDGEKQKAIALYRRLLSQPEWKQSGASSRAHQALERLGVATGGAMVNQVH